MGFRRRTEFFELRKVRLPDCTAEYGVKEFAPPRGFHEAARFEFFQMMGKGRGADWEGGAQVRAGRARPRGDETEDLEASRIGQDPRNFAQSAQRQRSAHKFIISGLHTARA